MESSFVSQLGLSSQYVKFEIRHGSLPLSKTDPFGLAPRKSVQSQPSAIGSTTSSPRSCPYVQPFLEILFGRQSLNLLDSSGGSKSISIRLGTTRVTQVQQLTNYRGVQMGRSRHRHEANLQPGKLEFYGILKLDCKSFVLSSQSSPLLFTSSPTLYSRAGQLRHRAYLWIINSIT